MKCQDNHFWLQDLSILCKCWNNLWPFSKDLSQPAGPYNALSRLVIIVGIVLAIWKKNIAPIIIMFISLAIIAIYFQFKYKGKKEEEQKYEQVLLNENPNANLNTQKREFGTATTLDGKCEPYGNPSPYDKCIAANQKPLGCMNTPVYGDQFIDKLYNPNMVPPGLNFNRVPDTTTMARPPYPLTSMDAITNWVGNTDNIGNFLMR